MNFFLLDFVRNATGSEKKGSGMNPWCLQNSFNFSFIWRRKKNFFFPIWFFLICTPWESASLNFIFFSICIKYPALPIWGHLSSNERALPGFSRGALWGQGGDWRGGVAPHAEALESSVPRVADTGRGVVPEHQPQVLQIQRLLQVQDTETELTLFYFPFTR